MGEKSVLIRKAGPDDATALADLNRQINDSDISVSEIARLLDSPGQEITVVAEVDGRIAGFACVQVARSWCFQKPWAHLMELYVRPSFRRRGLGRQLVEHFERLAREQGIEDVGMLTGATNTASQALYLSMGYQVEKKLSLNKQLPSDACGGTA